MRNIFIILAVCLLGGCAHRARTYQVPSHAALSLASVKLATKVGEARVSANRASEALAKVKASSKTEGDLITATGQRVESLLRVAPPELRSEIEALKADVAALQDAHRNTVADIDTVKAEQGTLTVVLEEANAAKNEVQRYSPEYLAQVEKQTEQLNTVEAKWAKDSKALWYYRVHWWGAWVLVGLAVVVAGILAFLKATGRLAGSLPRL